MGVVGGGIVVVGECSDRGFFGGVWGWVMSAVAVDLDLGGPLLGYFGVFKLEFL